MNRSLYSQFSLWLPVSLHNRCYWRRSGGFWGASAWAPPLACRALQNPLERLQERLLSTRKWFRLHGRRLKIYYIAGLKMYQGTGETQNYCAELTCYCFSRVRHEHFERWISLDIKSHVTGVQPPLMLRGRGTGLGNPKNSVNKPI